jgi:acetyl-CoA carboxylase biotin carboxyl carrier protein
MDYKEIKNLIDDVGNSKIDELNLEFPDGVKINIKKNNNTTSNNSIVKEEIPIRNVEEQTVAIPKKEEDYKLIKSPMVGTFYSRPSPKDDAFVKVGDKVKKGDVLCIIESMKLMNEIESEYDGEVAEICFNDEDVIEYGATLIKIK